MKTIIAEHLDSCEETIEKRRVWLKGPYHCISKSRTCIDKIGFCKQRIDFERGVASVKGRSCKEKFGCVGSSGSGMT
jgi:hypothetical protein